MGAPRLHRVGAYGVAILVIVVALVTLQVATVSHAPGTPILVFFFAIFVSAWYGGLGPGLVTTGLILLVTSGGDYTPTRTFRFVLFLGCGVAISVLLEALHAARRKVERSAGELDASRERLRQVLESITDYAIFTTDGAGRIASWSPGAERAFGYSIADAVDRPSTLLLDTGTTVAEDCSAVDVRCVRHDGSQFCASVSRTPLGRAGTAGTTWVLRDVTDRHRAEAELRAAKESAETANQTKDQFLAALSHELRTPLTPVLVSVSALVRDPEVPDGLRPALEMIHRNIVLEARLIDDLLDVTRIARGKLRLSREHADAHTLIERAVEICRDEVARSGLRLDVDLNAAVHHVEVDPARFQQIVWNLVKNAVKFTPKGGRITLRTSSHDAAPGSRLVVEVSDTGVGIDSGALETIFSAFEQGTPGNGKQQFGGLGLGLSISRSLAQALGGSLTATSAGKDRGARFTLDLPAAPAPPARAPDVQVDGREATFMPLHILLVEDNEDTLRVMTRLLRRRGYRVSTATCLAAAIEAAEQPFDLLVSDIGLPDGSGLELMRHVRGLRPVPGIALSGFGMEEDLRKSREAGFALHLTKPVDFPALDAAIQTTVQSAG